MGNLSDSGNAARNRDLETDALHMLPLSIIPLDSPALSRARLIKNVRLESMFEVFQGAGTGSGQLPPDSLEQMFDIPAKGSGKDTRTDGDKIRALAALSSFDVYSLRIQLRALGIDVENVESLRLSKAKRAELTRYMVGFTRPLIHQIYGGEDSEITDISQLIAMFANPERGDAMENLRLMTARLQIGLSDLPKFLEDYGDTFLSLAYFRECLDTLTPQFESFDAALERIRDSHQMRQNARLMATLDAVGGNLGVVRATVQGYLDSFDRETEAMWMQITAESFNRVKTLVENSHVTVGGILCGLSVKLGGWAARFGDSEGGVAAQSEFIMSDMRQGMDRLLALHDAAPAPDDVTYLENL